MIKLKFRDKILQLFRKTIINFKHHMNFENIDEIVDNKNIIFN